MAFVFAIYPAHEFAQREHFFLITSMPYILSIVLRLEQKYLSTRMAIVIGLFAAIGLSLKPFFLTLLIINESYLMYKTKNIWSWVRPEVVCIIVFIFIYLSIVAVYFQHYLFGVLPIVSQIYFFGMRKPIIEFMTNMEVLFCALACLFYGFFHHKSIYQPLHFILFLSMIGFICSFLIPFTIYMYQTQPAAALAFLVFGLSIAQIFYGGDAAFVPNMPQFKKAMLFLLCLLITYAGPLSLMFFYYHAGLSASRAEPTKIFLHFVETEMLNQPYMFLSMQSDGMIADLYPNMHANYVGSFSEFWWERGLLKLQKNIKTERDALRFAFNEKLLINTVINDLNKRPKFVLIDTMDKLKINYFVQFAKYPGFKAAWQPYQYHRTIGRYIIYKRVTADR